MSKLRQIAVWAVATGAVVGLVTIGEAGVKFCF